MSIKIVGAGIAGLLAANMLRPRTPVIFEQQSSLPNNHSAVLRFRSSVIQDVTGIEFKKVSVIKAALPWKNVIADALAYADKNTGTLRSDRSLPNDFNPVERYIAPPDLIAQLAYGANIKFGVNDSFIGAVADEIPIISTIPMPALMSILDYPQRHDVTFKYTMGINLIAKVASCDAYVSLYTPSPFYPFSRVSLTGDQFVAEVPSIENIDDPEIIFAAASLLGIGRERLSDIDQRPQQYAKIQPVPDVARKKFITWASDQHNIYSLGRYAVWRPTLLLDDLVQDIRLIERWIVAGDYARKLHGNRREA